MSTRLVEELRLIRPLIPTYIHLIVSAVFPIWTAAHAALSRPTSAAPAKKRKRTDDTDTDDEAEDASTKVIETLTPSDAIVFPILAGCTLAGLYFILTYLKDPEWLNWFLGIYFAGVGFFFMIRFSKDGLVLLRSIIFPKQYTHHGLLWKASNTHGQFRAVNKDGKHPTISSPLPGLLAVVPLPSPARNILWASRRLIYARATLDVRVYKTMQVKSPVDILDIVSIMVSVVAVWYHTFIGKPWFLTNLLGFSFCYGSLQFVTPGTATTGSLILSALFFYDIYFVFFTPMMVTVATKLDVPIKLLFPRPDGCIYPVGAEAGSEAMEKYLQCIAKKRAMAMLGLGDIVVPGMMLAFALRFDLYLFYLRSSSEGAQNIMTSVDATNDSKKPAYKSATGWWGERFWTSKALSREQFRPKQFPKTYFYASVIGYVVGMITTVLVMQIAQHAQPALLYLVPGVIISLWATALFKGDLKLLWNYSEVPEELTGKADNEKDQSKIEADKKKPDETRTGGREETAGSAAVTIEKKAANGSIATTSKSDPATKTSSVTKANQKDEQDEKHLFYFAISFRKSKTSSEAPADSDKSPSSAPLSENEKGTDRAVPDTRSDGEDQSPSAAPEPAPESASATAFASILGEKAGKE